MRAKRKKRVSDSSETESVDDLKKKMLEFAENLNFEKSSRT